MKISERKQRLRARGVVPVSQEPVVRSKATVTAPARAGGKAAPARTGATPQKGARPRWQPSPTYQMGFGLLYIIFAPFMLYTNWLALNAPARPHHPALHPGTVEYLYLIGFPVVFFLFGAWWFWRGLKARRLRATAAAAPAETPARKPQPARRSSQ